MNEFQYFYYECVQIISKSQSILHTYNPYSDFLLLQYSNSISNHKIASHFCAYCSCRYTVSSFSLYNHAPKNWLLLQRHIRILFRRVHLLQIIKTYSTRLACFSKQWDRQKNTCNQLPLYCITCLSRYQKMIKYLIFRTWK